MTEENIDETGQVFVVRTSKGADLFNVHAVRAVLNNVEHNGNPAVIYNKGVEASLAQGDINSCRASFDAKGLPIINVVSTQEDNPVRGFLNAKFAKVVQNVSGLCISHDASEDWFVPLNGQGSLMTLVELSELGVKIPEPGVD